MLKEKDAWPAFLQRLRDLKYRVNPRRATANGFEEYSVDLSDWRLSLSWMPIFSVSSELLERFSHDVLAESLLDEVREKNWRYREVMVLINGDGTELKAHLAGRSSRFFFVDEADQQEILIAASFTYAMQKHFCEQMPISSLAPYECGEVVEGARFFGRKKEINDIIRHHAANFAVIGVRRIGKTSLLRESMRLMLEQGENPQRIVWLGCSTIHSPAQFVEEIVHILNIRELPRLKNIQESLFSFPDFLKRMAKMHGGKITIFLDEADEFLIWARDMLLPTLRDSMTSGACRYIVSGFQTLLSEWADDKSPLYWAFRPINLGPFERGDVEEIVLLPARSLHLRIEDESSFIARLHADTRGHPYLIQFCLGELMKLLERKGSRVVSIGQLDDILTSDAFKALLLNSFMRNIAIRDKLLVYALLKTIAVDKDEYTQPEIYGALAKQHAPYSAEEIDEVCHRLVLAAVFVRNGAKYQFAFPVFPRVLRANHDLDHLLSVAKKEVGL